MLQRDLARALGISGAMVSRLVRRGMPTSSVDAAQRWRRRHLNPAHIHANAWRRGEQSLPEAPVVGDEHGELEPPELAEQLRLVQELADLAAELLPLGRFATVERALRHALRALPEQGRDCVLVALDCADVPQAAQVECDTGQARACIPVAVFEALRADVLAVVRADEATCDPSDLGVMSDEAAEWMARFWFSVAAGEVRVAASTTP